MWRSSYVMFVLFLLLNSALALVHVYYPISADVGTGEDVYVGKIGRGHTVMFIVDRGPEEDPYSRVSVDGWKYSWEAYGNRLWIYVEIPQDAKESTRACIELRGNASYDEFCPVFTVESGLLEAYPEQAEVNGWAGYDVPFRIVLLNRSVGSTKALVRCTTLPCGEKEVEIGPGDVKEVELSVNYPISGEWSVGISVEDLGNGERGGGYVTLHLLPNIPNHLGIARKSVVLNPFLLPVYALLAVIP